MGFEYYSLLSTALEIDNLHKGIDENIDGITKAITYCVKHVLSMLLNLFLAIRFSSNVMVLRKSLQTFT